MCSLVGAISYINFKIRLIYKGRREQAVRCLKQLRGEKIPDGQIEWEISALANYTGNEDKGSWKEVFNKDNRVSNCPSFGYRSLRNLLTKYRNAPLSQYWLCFSSRSQVNLLQASIVLYFTNFKVSPTLFSWESETPLSD